jgi:hypothetical protein
LSQKGLKSLPCGVTILNTAWPLLEVHGKQVMLVHQSVSDYLWGEHPDTKPEFDGFWIDAMEEDLTPTQDCLDSLLQSRLQYHRIYTSNERSRLKESPIFNYAAIHWGELAKHSAGLAAQLLELLKSLFKSGSAVKKH